MSTLGLPRQARIRKPARPRPGRRPRKTGWRTP